MLARWMSEFQNYNVREPAEFVRYIHTHISQRAHSALHLILLGQPHSKAQVRDANVSWGGCKKRNTLNRFEIWGCRNTFSLLSKF